MGYVGSSRVMVSWPTNPPLFKKCNLIKLIFHSESEKCNTIPNFFLIFIFDPRRRSSLPSHWCPSRWCHRWWSSIVLWRRWSTLVSAVPWWLSRNPQPSSLLILIFDPYRLNSLPSHWCPSRWCIEVVVVGRSLAAVVDVGAGRSVVVESRKNAIPNLILFLFSISTHSQFPSL